MSIMNTGSQLLIKENKTALFFSKMSLLILCIIMLWSMYPYFFWQSRTIAIYLLSFSFIACRILLWEKSKISYSKLIIILLYIVLLSEMLLPHFQSGTFRAFIKYGIVFSFVVIMTDEEKKELIDLFVNIFSLIVGISVVCYVIVILIGIDPPYSYSVIAHPDDASRYANFRNYIFFLSLDYDSMPYTRFQSIFSEPGHLGLVSSFLLYIKHYNLKDIRVLSIFVALIMSFSLASYLLLFIGFLLHKFCMGKILKRILQLFLFSVIIISACIYVYYEYPDSIFSELIVGRMEYDDEKGIVGNNRNSLIFSHYYENTFSKSSFQLLGRGPEFFQKYLAGQSASYQVFIVQFGYLGITLLFLLYASIVYFAKSKILAGLFVLYCVAFLQRPYALWEVELFLFIGATVFFKLEKTR